MDNITLDNKKLLAGITKAVGVLKQTYGPAGGNIILQETLYPYHSVRNDGKAIMDKIKLADPIENIGANILKEVCDKAEKDSGDGRKTTAILTEAILNEASKATGTPLEIKRSLDECLPIIIKAIDDQKKDISVDEIGKVAEISAESKELGAIIQEIYQKIGKEGIIEVDNSNLPETFYEITEGVRLRGAGCLPYSFTETGRAVWKNPKILIAKDKINSVDQLDPILKELLGHNCHQLVIYCDDIDMAVASRLAITHLQGGFKTLVIKSPTLWKNWLFEDFAEITGAKIIFTPSGKTFKNLTYQDLGTCEKIISTNDETRVIGIKDISEHLKKLEEAGLKDDQQKLRASWLNTKVAILKVGAGSESELSYISKKAKDAVSASYLALKGGVVSGGGVSLVNITSITNQIPLLPETIGGKVLDKVLEIPYRQIITNGAKEMWSGENVKDPALVVKNAITNAISIAGTVLTSQGIITLPEEDKNVKI